MRRACILLFVIISSVTSSFAFAQSPADKAASRRESQRGWELMKAEKFEEAEKAFQQAVQLDPNFEFAFYGLGRASMALKKFVSAISAFTRCKDLYEARAGQQFTSSQDRQRYRQDRLTELDEVTRQLQSGPQSAAVQEQLRQVSEQRRQIQEAISHGNEVSMTESTVPAWVTLSLGSAYFRNGNLPEAEKNYKASIASDPKSGEALNNLAVVYMETNRLVEADASIKAAKKAGFKVNPNLEQDIQDRLRKKP